VEISAAVRKLVGCAMEPGVDPDYVQKASLSVLIVRGVQTMTGMRSAEGLVSDPCEKVILPTLLDVLLPAAE
jgi:hypothetical protein